MLYTRLNRFILIYNNANLITLRKQTNLPIYVRFIDNNVFRDFEYYSMVRSIQISFHSIEKI